VPVYVEVPLWLLLGAGVIVLIAEWTRAEDRKAVEWESLTEYQRLDRKAARLNRWFIAGLVGYLICALIQILAIIAPLT
jgi:hypothetical protein